MISNQTLLIIKSLIKKLIWFRMIFTRIFKRKNWKEIDQYKFKAKDWKS